MINVKEEDIGKKVYYIGGSVLETGTITKLHNNLVFVRYEGDQNSKATLLKDLVWEEPKVSLGIEPIITDHYTRRER